MDVEDNLAQVMSDLDSSPVDATASEGRQKDHGIATAAVAVKLKRLFMMVLFWGRFYVVRRDITIDTFDVRSRILRVPPGGAPARRPL